MSKTIVKKGYANIRDEKVSNTVITPGMLVRRLSNDKVDTHAIAGGPVAPLFAIEDENQGKGITDNYASGDVVKLWRPVPGEVVYAISDDQASGAIAIGDFVESAGDGRLRKHSQANTGTFEYPNNIVGVALEAVTPGPSTPRFLVEII